MKPMPADRIDALQFIIEFLPCGISVTDGNLEMLLCNQLFRRLLDFPDSLFADGLPSLPTLFLFNARRGEYGPGEPELLADQRSLQARQMLPHVFERQRPDGTVLEVRGTPLPNGGFVSIYTDITDRKRAEQAAQRYSTYLDTVLNSLPQGITVIDEKLDVVLWNKPFETIMEMPAGEMQAGTPFETVIRRNAERGEYGPVDPVQKAKEAVALALKFEPHRMTRTRPSGQTLEIEGRAMQIDGKVAGFVSTYTDITERIRHEEALSRVQNLMNDAIHFSPTFIWETDAAGNFSFLQGIEHILGFTAQELLGRARLSVLGGEGRALVEQRMAQQQAFKNLVAESHNRQGTLVWLSSSAQPVHDGAGRYQGYRGVDVDVTEITRARQALEQMALHDALTGLANRHKFRERYELERLRQQRSGAPLSLLLVDIDHFKVVNDRCGHIVGDLCLKEVARLLLGCVRNTDLVARFGGEEFLILLAETGSEDALLVAESLRLAVQQAVIATGIETPATLQVTVSLGLATLLKHEKLTLEAHIEKADAAVYAAKEGGRNQVRMAGL